MGYAVGHGPQIAPGEPAAERYSFGEVVSDGLQARMGSLTANQEWFKVWQR